MFSLNEIPDSCPHTTTLKQFVSREPMCLFNLRKNSKNEEEKEKLNQLFDLLGKKLPKGFKIGAAVDGGDSFFDSVAQALNELGDKGLILRSRRFNVKNLRASCKQYAQQIHQSKKESWLDITLKGEGRKFHKYVRNIEFTAKDVEETSSSSKKFIWGRHDIEGKMICEKYGIKFRIVELREVEKDGLHVTKTKTGVGNNIVHLVKFRNRFVPLLFKIGKDVKRSLKISVEEVYGDEMGFDSNNITQSYISATLQDIENSSLKHGKENSKMAKTQASLYSNPNKEPKRARLNANTINNDDKQFPSCGDESKQKSSYRKRKISIEDKYNDAPKRMHIDIKDAKDKYSEGCHHLQYELDNAYETNGCIPHQLIKLMYQIDLSILCSLRESLYKPKYPSLSLTFGDSDVDKFGNITLHYNKKSIHVKIESIDNYYMNNNINYAQLFNREKERRTFFMNNYFDSFSKHLLFKSDSLSNTVEYLIIYTNAGLDFTGEMKLKQSRSKSSYPFKFESMDIESCIILKDFLLTNNFGTRSGFYQFSKNKATREELLKRLEFSSATRKEIKERKLSPEFEKEIKETFLDKLVFAVNQPNREEMNTIVRDEISDKKDYIEWQEKVLCDLTTQKMHKKYGEDVSEIAYGFSLLMCFLHGMFLQENVFSIDLKPKSCDTSNAIAINYKNRITYVKPLFADSNIGYSHLFPSRTQERKNKFCVNKHFTIFMKEFEKNNNIRYYIMYTDADLDLTEEGRLKKGQSRDFYPLKLHSIDFQKKKYKILRHFSFINKNALYQFSQEEATILINLLKFPPSFQSKKRERLTDEDEQKMKKKFLSKLILAVNQPNREEINNIMRNEIENKFSNTPYNYTELHELALRCAESRELGSITKGKIEKFFRDIQNNISSSQRIQNVDEEIKFARTAVGREGTSTFNNFLQFLIKAEGTKYLRTLKGNGINPTNVSSILNRAGSCATKAFRDLYYLWFDAKGNKTQYLKSLEDEGVNLPSMSSILRGAGASAAKAFQDLYDLWFDAKGNKTIYLKTLENKGVSLTNMSSVLNGAGAYAAKACRDIYDLWFDAKGNKTLYLKSLEDEGLNLANMSSILSGSGAHAAKAFQNLYDLWFDVKGNKTMYLKTLEDEGINLPSMSSVLNGSGCNAADAFKDLYNLWFDAKGNKTYYLKILEIKGVNLHNMSSILSTAGANATKAFRDLYDRWFDEKGNKTAFLKTLENEEVNLPCVSSILHGAGSKAGKAFKELYDLWFDADGKKSQYLKTLEDEGVNLSNVSSILRGAGANATKAFKELYDLWFDAKENKTQYLKTLEGDGISLPIMSTFLHGAGANAAKAFQELYNLWFDAQGRRTKYLKTLEEERVNLPSMSSILHGAGSKAAKSYKDLFDLWFDAKGNGVQYLRTLEVEGVNLPNMSNMLNGAGANSAKAFKELYDLWFDAHGNKTHYLKTLEVEGINLQSMSSILSRAGANSAKAFRELYHVWFDARGNKTQYLKTLENENINISDVFRILSGAGTNSSKAFKELYDLWFDIKGNKTTYFKILEDKGLVLSTLSSVLYGAGSKAAKSFKDLFDLWFDSKGIETLYLTTFEGEGVSLPVISSILYRAGSRASKAFKDLFYVWFDAKGSKTERLKILENEGVSLLNISSILNKTGVNAAQTFIELYYIWFDEKGIKSQYTKTLEDEGVNLPNLSRILHKAGSKAGKTFKDLYYLWFDEKGNKSPFLKTMENEGVNLPRISSILHGAGSKAGRIFKDLYFLWFDEKRNKTLYLKTMEDEGLYLVDITSFLRGEGSKAGKAFKDLYFLWFDEIGNKTQFLKTVED